MGFGLMTGFIAHLYNLLLHFTHHYVFSSPSASTAASRDTLNSPLCQSQVKVTLPLTVGQSVNLGVEPHLGLMTRYLLLFDSYVLVFVGRPLWREDGSVFCICCWPSPAQYFSGPSPLDLVTKFYCLSFETSLFVASYDSQGHGGGIRPHLHTVSPLCQSQSHIATDGQSVCLSWCRAPSGAHGQILITVWQLLSCP
jgi:hypothetical protein